MQKHKWLQLRSTRTQPYAIEDISVIIPSVANRYENRWKWFWPQYLKNTDPKVVRNTFVSSDPEESWFFRDLVLEACVIPIAPYPIVSKTIGALSHINTRLTFRLANDIMVVRPGWEQLLLDQFNAVDKLQIIAEMQHGETYPQEWHKMANDWSFFKKEYPDITTAAVYPHGSRIFAQTAVWNAYYSLVSRYTSHDHDELFFSQMARADGTVFANFRNINAYLAHVGFPLKDFDDERLKALDELRHEYESRPSGSEFSIL